MAYIQDIQPTDVLFYIKTILYPSGDPNFIGDMGALTIIYPKSYQQGVEPIV